MPFQPPALDDRSFDDLVEELVARIPAHTPEWTNPRVGDPGRTLIDLFAWLADTLLYRVNLIPERQRLAFLRLLGAPMRPAIPATGLVTISIDDPNASSAVYLAERAFVSGAVNFETQAEVTVLPIQGAAFYKRKLTDSESTKLQDLVTQLGTLYDAGGATPTPYATTPVFAGGEPSASGLDLIQDTVDGTLWIALLAAKQDDSLIAKIRETLGQGPDKRQQLLNVGIVPAIQVPALFEDVGPRAQIGMIWEVSTQTTPGDDPIYVTVDPVGDTTGGFIRQGVVRLALPGVGVLGAPSNDVLTDVRAGVGTRPPRLDDPDQAGRLLGWLRLRPRDPLHSLRLSWVGINAVSIDQRRTVTSRVVGQSDGSPEQSFRIANESVDSGSLQLQVEAPGTGYQLWQQIEDLSTAGRDDLVYTLDPEAGTVTFGNGMRGRIPDAQQRIRVASMRTGGGSAGNLPGGSISKIEGRDQLTGAAPALKLKLKQALPTAGGVDAETLEEAERRVPSLFRNRDRAITEEDYRLLAAQTPGVQIKRVDLMPRFKPQQRMSEVPGVVSVMVLPDQPLSGPPNPRPDRPLLEAVFAYLDARRPLGTELYVIGCEYVPVGVSLAVSIADGFGQDAVLTAVRDAVRQFLWPLPPGGLDGNGWARGRRVRDLEVEVAVARVPGVSAVNGLNLFNQNASGAWQLAPRVSTQAPREVALKDWQLPELLAVVVSAQSTAPADLQGAPQPSDSGMAVPVVPEVC